MKFIYFIKSRQLPLAVFFAIVSAIQCANPAMDPVQTSSQLRTLSHSADIPWVSLPYAVMLNWKLNIVFAFESFRISIDKEGEKGSGKVFFDSSHGEDPPSTAIGSYSFWWFLFDKIFSRL